jgi:NAD(P)-dependent dehydrogenase (short-subunit alcohol dehydrogenase family)
VVGRRGETWERVLAVNLTGLWLCMRAEIHQMLSQGHGSIVNKGSIFGLVGSATSPALDCQQARGDRADEVGGPRIRSSRHSGQCSLPFIDSPMLDRLFARHPECKDPLVARHPIMRLGSAEEVAAAVIWLCSDARRSSRGRRLWSTAGMSLSSRRPCSSAGT